MIVNKFHAGLIEMKAEQKRCKNEKLQQECLVLPRVLEIEA